MPGSTPQVADWLGVRTCCYTNNQIALNDMLWLVTAVAGGGLTLQQIATRFEANVGNIYKAWMSPDARWRGAGVRNLTEPRTLEFASVGLDGIGIAGGTNLPTQVSGLLSLVTGLAGRKFRGRIFPGFPSTAFADVQGLQNAAGSVALGGIAAAISTSQTMSVGGISTTMQLFLRHPDIVVSGVRVVQGTPAIGWNVSTRFATQRRRGQFGRTNVNPF